MHQCLLPLLACLALLGGCATTVPDTPPAAAAAPPEGSTATLTLLETTDLHASVLGYDYYRLQPDPTVGLSRTATLIQRARSQFPNTLLFDDGDAIEGTALGDYQARRPPPCDQALAVYRAMDTLGYDAATLGNHEFDHGLDYLARVTGAPTAGGQRCAGPRFPLVLANVLWADSDRPLLPAWTLVDTRITARTPDGRTITAPLRVGVIGFTTPQITDWSRQQLGSLVRTLGVVEAARRELPRLRAEHPDLVVALEHGGLDTAPYTPRMGNAGWYLAQVPGIDAMLLGHAHQRFPGPRYASLPGVNDERGLVHGVPAVMAGLHGKVLGLVHLQLTWRDGRWVSDPARARSETWPICPQPDQCVPPDPVIATRVSKAHEATIAWVKTPIGRSDFRMSSYFADLGDASALAIVNAAQLDYLRRWLAQGHPQLAGLPLLSAAAAFRSGASGAGDYTDVKPGPLTLRSAADLYLYANTLAAVKIDGAELKAWLERSAERFNRIDPKSRAPQPLINRRFAGYNFDQIQADGLHYVIDVSQAVGQRIVKLTWRGKPIQPRQQFIVVTNSYRAGGGGDFPGLDGSKVVLAAPDGNREVLVRWIEAHPQVRRDELPGRSWRFAPLSTRAPVTFTSAAGKLPLARAAGLHLRLLHDNGDGTATYAVDLSAE